MNKVSMKTKWKDASSYSAGERGNVEPTVWNLVLEGLSVTVHRWHGIDDVWFGSCSTMGIDRHQLESPEHEKAKAEFIAHLRGTALNWVAKLGRAQKP